MAQGAVERCIGRLLTDEASRVRFARDPDATLNEIARQAGGALTPAECAALRATSAAQWQAMADTIDPRLQRLSVGSEAER